MASWRRRRWSAAHVAALLGIAVAAGCTSGRGPGDGALGVGSQAPDFELPALDGGTVRLSQLRGKIVFLNFWATWCAPCREEMPSMERLNRELNDPELVMLAVSVDEGGEAAVREFLADLPHSYRVLLDASTATRRLGTRTGASYGITGVPETFLIDRNGYIVEHIVGPRNWSDPGLVDFFRALIAS